MPDSGPHAVNTLIPSHSYRPILNTVDQIVRLSRVKATTFFCRDHSDNHQVVSEQHGQRGKHVIRVLLFCEE